MNVIGEDDIGPIFAEDDSTTKTNGGPAFPVPPGTNGMSLRDWFASMAVHGQAAGMHDDELPELARSAYALADAMIEARKR